MTAHCPAGRYFSAAAFAEKDTGLRDAVAKAFAAMLKKWERGEARIGEPMINGEAEN